MKLDDLKAELDDAAKGLAYNSIQNGCADCGLAANLATRSLTAITDLEALVGELGEALEPFRDSFDAARESYIRRYKSNPMLAANNFDAMPDQWDMGNLIFSMGDYRKARATLAKLEKARG